MNEYTPMLSILKGLKYNVVWTVISIFFGILIGFFSAYARFSKAPGSFLLSSYAEIMKGTPLVLQISIACFVIPKGFINIPDSVWCGIIFSLNSGAYLSEGFLNQFLAIGDSYWKTAEFLGFSRKQTMKNIIVPVVMQNSKGMIKNEIITLLKDTSIVSLVGFTDIFTLAKRYSLKTGEYLLPLLLVGLAFFLLNLVQNLLNKQIIKFFETIIKFLFYERKKDQENRIVEEE